MVLTTLNSYSIETARGIFAPIEKTKHTLVRIAFLTSSTFSVNNSLKDTRSQRNQQQQSTEGALG